ncbi:MAG: type II toxin-antitoxin system HicB family antitoxin [Candidatus Nitrosotenuis sp.]|nr:type II toxin-antitoxin system HicB family antitoxin [Candidatus Nitrosotenuis sp.]
MSFVIPPQAASIGTLFVLEQDTTYQKLKKNYRISLQKDEDGRIVAKCLDLKGVVTDGANEEEAITNAYEAIQAMLESMGITEEFNLIVES